MLPLRARRVRFLARCATVVALVVPSLLGPVALAEPTSEYANACSRGSPLCPEVNDSAQIFGHYVGHDEPSLLFYSKCSRLGEFDAVPGAATGGPARPTQHVWQRWHIQLPIAPAFWFGMALCDTESSPNPGTKSCPASSDTNIFDGVDPAAPDYVGNHPAPPWSRSSSTHPVGCPGQRRKSSTAAQLRCAAVVRGDSRLQFAARGQLADLQQRRLSEPHGHRVIQFRLHYA